jgi:hypothetical protein
MSSNDMSDLTPDEFKLYNKMAAGMDAFVRHLHYPCVSQPRILADTHQLACRLSGYLG